MSGAKGRSKAGTLARAAGRALRSAVSMTATGDAMRLWTPLVVAFVAVYGLFPNFRYGQQNFLPTLFFLDLFYFLFLTWAAMYRTSPEGLRMWPWPNEPAIPDGAGS